MVFSVLALSGFEAPAPLAQETKRPGKFIGRAVMLSLVLIGIFYVFTSYASAIGWGTGTWRPSPRARTPTTCSATRCGGPGWWFIFIALVNSAIGVRTGLHQRGHPGDLHHGPGGHPARAVRPDPPGAPHSDVRDRGPAVDRDRRDPAGRHPLAPDVIFGFLGTITTLAVIILYVMANLALTAYIRREHRTTSTSGGTACSPGSGRWPCCRCCGPPCIRSRRGPTDHPICLPPGALVGVGVHAYGGSGGIPGALEARRDDAGRPDRRTPQGDVDWDAPAASAPQADA